MELVVLGSGTSEPHPDRSSSSYWLNTQGGTVLLDCSASSVHRMAQEHLDWANLDAIWISHFHLDHCGGLGPFLFGTRHARATRDRRKPLRLLGANGLRKLVEALDSSNGNKLLDQPFPVDIVEIRALERFDILPGVEAVAYSTPHTPESHAIHIRENDTTFAFSADTGFDETIATFARRVDLLLMECSFVRDKPVEIHLELSEAVHLIRRAEPHQAILTHLYSEWDDVDFATEVEKLKPGVPIMKAFDGMRITIAENEK